MEYNDAGVKSPPDIFCIPYTALSNIFEHCIWYAERRLRLLTPTSYDTVRNNMENNEGELT